MSDFDKEAERERLREQYEREKQDREVTGRMSELLLQGATMTNKHCDACGNPIFRYRGQEFCPVCQDGAAQGDEQDATADDRRATQQGRADQQAAGSTQQDAEPAQANTPVEQAGPPAQARQPATRSAGQPERQPQGRADRSAGDLSGARASLVRTIVGLTREAEETRDVGRKRELLAAAREAAETLAALDRVNN